MDKVVASAAEAVADIPDGASLAVGGFGLCGVPIGADRRRCSRQGAADLEVGLEQLRRRRAGASACC